MLPLVHMTENHLEYPAAAVNIHACIDEIQTIRDTVIARTQVLEQKDRHMKLRAVLRSIRQLFDKVRAIYF